jgi:hypothetical protein
MNIKRFIRGSSINAGIVKLASGQNKLNVSINISSVRKATIQMKEAARLQRHHDNM